MTPAQRRAARIAQAKHRGTKESHRTQFENALLMLAWEAEILSEGQLSHILDTDRVSIRKMRLDLLDQATKLAESLYGTSSAASTGRGEGGEGA
jgi:hypothetical protein